MTTVTSTTAMQLSKPSNNRIKVAVLGSGISGSTVARSLADMNAKNQIKDTTLSNNGKDDANISVEVTVFEVGRGVGGRTSTRTTRGEDSFSFDHGAQYIGKPKTNQFQEALDQWSSQGIVKSWDGKFASVKDADIDTSTLETNNSPQEQTNDYMIQMEDSPKPHYVGYPSMNSICKSLLDHEHISVVLETRACATFNSQSQKWDLTSDTTTSSSSTSLGQYDWLISSDRLSAMKHRPDLSDIPQSTLQPYQTQVDPIESVPSLTLMVVFESSVPLPMDGITFLDDKKRLVDGSSSSNSNGGIFGSLGWAARDSSKPGRERKDGKECWVVQSHPTVAANVLSSIEEAMKKSNNDGTFNEKRQLAREQAKEILLHDFLKAVTKLSGVEHDDLPKIVSAIGHRWSAAFPVPPSHTINTDTEGNENLFYVDPKHQFVACGDYIGKYSGRIEGAYLSASAAADAIQKMIQQ